MACIMADYICHNFKSGILAFTIADRQCPFSLLKTSAYYKSLSYSLLNISIGFFTGLFAGVVLAVAASVNTFLQSVIDVPVKIIRSIPVASFIILALLWVDSAHLSTFIAAITIMPVIYTNTFSGIAHTDRQMKEMAEVFHFSPFKNWFTYICLMQLPIF